MTRRDQLGVVIGEPKKMAGREWYPVIFGNDPPRHEPGDYLEVYVGGETARDLLLQGAFGQIEGFRKLVTSRRLSSPLNDTVYSFRSARIEFYPYQFRPLLKFLRSPNGRLLIADEVGLGKTIEAGLIMIELAARDALDRVLVVCPSALCTKWELEMEERFGEEFRIYDSSGIRSELERLHRRGGVGELRAICSLQSLRRDELRDLISNTSPDLDLTIIDEAHHMRNSETLSHRLGTVLSENSTHLLLLTATPIHLGETNLHQLLRVLDPNDFESKYAFERLLESNRSVVAALRELGSSRTPDFGEVHRQLAAVEQSAEADRFRLNPIYGEVVEKLSAYSPERRDHVVEIQANLQELAPLSSVLTRTRKRQVQTAVAKRVAVVREPEFSEEEMRFYDDITRICREHYRRSDGNPAGEFGVMVRQRQMASSIPAMISHCLAQIDGGEAKPEDYDGDIECEELVNHFEAEAPSYAEKASLLVDPEFCATIRWGKAHIRRDAKLEELIKLLKSLRSSDPDAKVIVFTYFKGTLRHICNALKSEGINSVFVSGDVPSVPADPEKDERRRVLESFRADKRIRVLVSTEVGSEGLDMQFARVLVNYDLPWNPMIVEQRIGRLDRIGQLADRITIVNFAIPGTIEARILDRLYDRIQIFKESIGDLESILGTHIRKLTNDLLRSVLTADEEAERIERAALVLEQERLDLQKLEEEGSKFLAYDAYIEDEVSNIQRLRRFVSPEEIELFVRDFLVEMYPECDLTPDRGRRRVFQLHVSQELVKFIRQMQPQGDRRVQEFCLHAGREVSVTFIPELAFGDRKLVQISHRHPLVRSIVRHYEDSPEDLHPVAFLGVDSEAAEAGEYLYELLLVRTRGVRASRALEAVFVGLEDGRPLPPDVSEVLLGELLSTGVTVEEDPDLESEFLQPLLQECDDEFGRRAAEREANLRRANDAMVANRIAALDASVGRGIAQAEMRLEEAHLKQYSQQYIRMQEGTIRNLKVKYEIKREEAEACRTVEVALLETVGVGIVRVG